MRKFNIKSPYLSVIIPAYNSQKYIKNVIERVSLLLESKKISYEVICISDGSEDNTLVVAEKLAKSKKHNLKSYGYVKNKGKGYAVRYGMKKASGKVVGFIDADEEILPLSIINILKVLETKKADIVVGSKWNENSKVKYPPHRKAISFMFALIVRILFGLKVRDTQAGVKVMRKEVIENILPYLNINGFAFDVEILVQAQKFGFNKILEGPIIVDASESSDSSILKSFGIVKESFKMLFDILKLFVKARFN